MGVGAGGAGGASGTGGADSTEVRAVVQTHGSLRIGEGDVGVNPRRNAQLWGFLQAQAGAGAGAGALAGSAGAGACVPGTGAVGR